MIALGASHHRVFMITEFVQIDHIIGSPIGWLQQRIIDFEK